MRFSVECAFPHLRKRGAGSRKSALCNQSLTENRILQPAPHGKPHSSPAASRKSAFCNQSLTEKCTLQLALHGKPHSAAVPRSRRDQKVHSAQPPHGKAHSAPVPRSRRDQKAHSATGASPKTALCPRLAPLNMVPRRSRLTHRQGSGAQSARSRRCHSRGSRPWVCLRCPG